MDVCFRLDERFPPVIWYVTVFDFIGHVEKDCNADHPHMERPPIGVEMEGYGSLGHSS